MGSVSIGLRESLVGEKYPLTLVSFVLLPSINPGFGIGVGVGWVIYMRDEFIKYINATNQDGSNKASSYIKALDWLVEMLRARPFDFSDCIDIWNVRSVERLRNLYDLVQQEKHKGSESDWCVDEIPRSYLRDGFCSAAVKCLQEFLVEENYEERIFSVFDDYKGDEAGLPQKLEIELDYPDFLLDESRKGEEVVRAVRVRSNQNVFRRIILRLYNQACCITGLNIPEVNRASHIIPWSEDESKRLDPRNGLCLSATYDAAFDRNLISLDDEYRIILSRDIKDHYTSDSVKEHFLNKEGDKICLPGSYLPHLDYLDSHRRKGSF